jgi:hypothetical protein
MEANISKQIAKLPNFSRQRLLDLWQELYGRSAPPGIRRELMVPFLTYRLQEKAYGGLKPSTRAELRRIARSLENSTASPNLRILPKIKTGTHILRKWKGEMHDVGVTEFGYEYRGSGFRSLSEIARKITGTRWSGPAFFGLRNGVRSEGDSDD